MGIQSAAFNPVWLSAPDVLISLGLLYGLRRDRWFWGLVASFSLIIGLTISRTDWGGLMPGLVFLLISRYFSRTLEGANQTPLITQMAQRIRGPELPMSIEVRGYTTALTRVWSALLSLLALNQILSVALAKDSWPWIMGNTLAPIIIFLLLVLEPFYRRIRLPNEPRHSLRHFFSRLADNGWIAED